MDLLIRNVDPEVVYAIDQMVADQNKHSVKKLSRNEFIKDCLNKIPLQKFYREADNKTAIQIKSMNDLLDTNLDALNKIFYLLVNGDLSSASSLTNRIGSDMNDQTE